MAAAMSQQPERTPADHAPHEWAPGDRLRGCGYEWEHTARDLGNGGWECAECGAEGWAEDERVDR